MKKEDKELLLKDLCARLPYGVKILHEGWNYEWDDELSTVERVVGIDDKFIYTKVINTHNGKEYRDDKHTIRLFDDKLFLRPMSSMTEEEKKEFEDKFNSNLDIDEILGTDLLPKDFVFGIGLESMDVIPTWLNKKMFDWRRVYDEEEKKWKSMIDAGIAIKAPEGMYNF